MLRLAPKKVQQADPAQTPKRRRHSRGDTLSDFAEAIIARPQEKTMSPVLVSGFAQIAEALMLTLIGAAVFAGFVQNGQGGFYSLVTVGGVLLANLFFNIAKTHRISAYRTTIRQCGRVLAAWSATFIVILVGAFLLKMSELVSRGWILGWYVIGCLALVVFRLALHSLVNRWTRQGKLKRRTVIVGGGEESAELIRAIRAGSENDIELYGLFDDRVDERSPDEVAGCPKLGNVADLVKFSRRTPVDLVIVSMPLSAEKRVLQLLKQILVLPVDIRLSAHMNQLKFRPSTYSYIGTVPTFDLADRPIVGWSLVFKWLFDKAVALTALILFAPLMITTAIAIRLESKGPVLFRQKRHGFNNELIEIYKFRSMYTDMSDTQASKLVTRDDPRVTRVGRFIRRTSVDELPQLFNVLKGDISIVGPRPHALQAKAADKLYNDAVDGYFARHKVKPGMTGWAQIHGWRGETDTVEKIMQRVNHDIYYIEHWSPLLDLYIVLMTPISLFSKKENAY